MQSEVSQLRQASIGVVETNRIVEQSEFEQQRQLYIRAKKAGIATKEILQITGFYVSDEDTRGLPHTMIGAPVDLGQVTVDGVETGVHTYAKPYVAFDKDEHTEIERGRFFKKKSHHYIPDFEKVSKVGVIYLVGPAKGSELAHERSVHWNHAEATHLDEITAIEEGLEVIQNALGRLVIVQDNIAS